MAKTPKRLTIGFFVNDLEGDYSDPLCNGMVDAAAYHDVNLIVFPGGTLNYIYGSEYNHNIIYEYAGCNNVDALIIGASIISGFIPGDKFMDFVFRYKPLPMVSIGIPFEGIPSVLINNRPGFKQVINHLIHHHGKRRIAFIKGLEGHGDAEERFSVYREVLKENGLEYDPDLVAPGDFSIGKVEEAIRLFDQRKVSYEAIVASNDIMACKALEVLRERNISVPDQVAVTGFDNCLRAKYSNVSLTTVKQPIYELAQKALEMALELIEGKQLENVVLDTEMVVRESCGCLSESLQSFETHPVNLELKPDGPGLLDINSTLRRFLALNLEKIDIQALNLGLLKEFVANCFQVLTRDDVAPKETEELFRGFKFLIDLPDLDYNDISAIQKVITALKKWLSQASARNRSLQENFFQKLRIYITDIAIKMQGSRLNLHYMEIYQLRGLLMEMVSKIHNYHEQLHSIIPRLRAMHINDCYIYLYDQPIRYSRDDVWHNPPMLNLALAFNSDNWVLGESAGEFVSQRLPWEKVISHEYLPQKRYTLMLKPLYVHEEHFGLILMDFNMPHNYLFGSLTIEVSCAVRLSLLFHEREEIDRRLQEVVKELEEYNRKLQRVSQTDELTGLYNRRGFLNLAKQRLEQAQQQGKSGLVFYGDMDGLKKINDRYGHDEGDIAIRAISKILIRTFWAADIIARIGGDEFTVFTVGTDLEILPKIEERLRKQTEEYNRQAEKPYEVSITMGAVPFQSGKETLENLLNQADQILYQEKRHKKRRCNEK